MFRNNKHASFLAPLNFVGLDADLGTRSLFRYRVEVICAGVLLVMALNCILAISRTSITSDEIMHIPAGYYSLTAAEYRMNNEHPPLAKMWSALPLLILLPKDTGPAQANGDFRERGAIYSYHFWSLNHARALSISFWSRAAMVPVTISLGILLFLSARKLFGARAALFCVLLYSLEPTVLGHGKLVHTDIPAAFVYLLFFFTLLAYARHPTFFYAFLLGLVTSVALLTKFSMIVLIPVLAAFFLFRMWSRRNCPGRLVECCVYPLMVGVVILLSINVAYQFRNPPLSPGDLSWIELTSHNLALGSPAAVIRAIGILSRVLPTDFLFGLYNVAIHDGGGHSASILGQYGYRGWWYYFPVAFAFKTSVLFLALSVLALLWSIWRIIFRKDYVFLQVWIPLVIYSALAMSSHINIGVRHFLPSFPFLFMLAGALLDQMCNLAPKLGFGMLVASIGIMGVETVHVFPYYLSYTNQLKGHHPAWHYLSDSNVEWGDAAPDLAKFLKDRGVHKVRGALLGGGRPLGFYDIEYIHLFASNPIPETEYIALGASYLNGSTVDYGDASNGRGTESERVNFFDSYRNRKPVAILGNSIYVYKSEHSEIKPSEGLPFSSSPGHK